MGSAMAERLLDAGHDVAVWNRTRAKADQLAGAGAKVVERISDLAQADLVFIMVSTPADLEEVVTGAGGLLSAAHKPRIIVDCSSVGADTSAHVREAASACGVRTTFGRSSSSGGNGAPSEYATLRSTSS